MKYELSRDQRTIDSDVFDELVDGGAAHQRRAASDANRILAEANREPANLFVHVIV